MRSFIKVPCSMAGCVPATSAAKVTESVNAANHFLRRQTNTSEKGAEMWHVRVGRRRASHVRTRSVFADNFSWRLAGMVAINRRKPIPAGDTPSEVVFAERPAQSSMSRCDLDIFAHPSRVCGALVACRLLLIRLVIFLGLVVVASLLLLGLSRCNLLSNGGDFIIS